MQINVRTCGDEAHQVMSEALTFVINLFWHFYFTCWAFCFWLKHQVQVFRTNFLYILCTQCRLWKHLFNFSTRFALLTCEWAEMAGAPPHDSAVTAMSRGTLVTFEASWLIIAMLTAKYNAGVSSGSNIDLSLEKVIRKSLQPKWRLGACQWLGMCWSRFLCEPWRWYNCA